MRHVIPRLLMTLALGAVVSSCASKVETHLAFPPVADLAQEREPAYPVAALEPGDVGAKAESDWRDSVLIWGRKGWAQNRRVCQWAVDLGMVVPTGYCSK